MVGLEHADKHESDTEVLDAGINESSHETSAIKLENRSWPAAIPLIASKHCSSVIPDRSNYLKPLFMNGMRTPQRTTFTPL
jgi:hypothetical protein